MDNSSIADIFIEIWRVMSPEKRFNTLKELEKFVGIEIGDLPQETRYVLELVDQIVRVQPPQMIQA